MGDASDASIAASCYTNVLDGAKGFHGADNQAAAAAAHHALFRWFPHAARWLHQHRLMQTLVLDYHLIPLVKVQMRLHSLPTPLTKHRFSCLAFNGHFAP